MSDRRDEGQRREELALVSQDAAIAAVTAVASVELGPVGIVVGALLGPFASHAARRLRELLGRVQEAGLDTDTIAAQLDENESLAQLIAEVVRGTVESDLEAKRKLLARAAVRALKDDAVVDEESVFVRTANVVDTTDVRVLAIMGERRDEWVTFKEIARDAPGLARAAGASSARLFAAGLLVRPSEASLRPPSGYRPSRLGQDFLDRLLEEGLDDELRRREHGSP